MKNSEIYLKAAELIHSRRGGKNNRMCWAIDEAQGSCNSQVRKEFVDSVLDGEIKTGMLFPEDIDGNQPDTDDQRVLTLLFAAAAAEYEELPMRKYNASVACSVQAYSNHEVEAKYDWEAIEIAKELAREGGSSVAWDTADDHRVVDVQSEEDEEIVEGSESIYVP